MGLGDTVEGGSGTDWLYFDLANTTSGQTINILTGQGAGGAWTGIEFISGTLGSGNDTVTVGAQFGALDGGGGVNTLVADYSGLLPDGSAPSFIDLSPVNGTPRMQVYTYGSSNYGGGAIAFDLTNFQSFKITGTPRSDIIHGGDYGNIIHGGGGGDSLYGGAGIDVLDGGAGDDNIDGGGQSLADPATEFSGDVASFSGDFADYAISQDTASGIVTVADMRPGSPDGTDQLNNIEILKFADITYRASVIIAGQATGFIDFAGTTASDTFYGSEDENTAVGGAGGDQLFGYGGSDTLDGGTDNDLLDGGDGNDNLLGGAGNDTLIGGAGSNTVDGGDGDDLFRLEQGTNDTAVGGAGNDAFYFGAAFTAGDSVNGGAGTRDQLGLQGNYAGGVTFGTNVTGVEQAILLPGNDTRFGDVSGAFYSYAVTTGNAAIAAGQQMVFQANILRSGENFTLDASGELDGSVFTYGGQGNDALTGSQGSDAFFFGTARFGAGDVVSGQGGALDSLGLQGNYAGASAVSFGAGQLIGVEQLVFLSNSDTRFGGAGSGTPYNYTITTHDGNVAAGSRMIIQANTLVSDEVLNFNGSAELDGVFSIFSGNGADTLRGGAGNDTISGRGGADMLFGGGGNDTFLYTNLTDSTPGARDTFGDFSTGDLIDLSRLDAITGGANDAFSFIGSAAFSNTAGQLRAVNTGGSNWLVEADTNGDAIADFALFLTVSDNHPITVSDFLP